MTYPSTFLFIFLWGIFTFFSTFRWPFFACWSLCGSFLLSTIKIDMISHHQSQKIYFKSSSKASVSFSASKYFMAGFYFKDLLPQISVLITVSSCRLCKKNTQAYISISFFICFLAKGMFVDGCYISMWEIC